MCKCDTSHSHVSMVYIERVASIYTTLVVRCTKLKNDGHVAESYIVLFSVKMKYKKISSPAHLLSVEMKYKEHQLSFAFAFCQNEI